MNNKIYTEIDTVLDQLVEGPMELSTISRNTSIPEKFIEHWSKFLEESGLIEIEYTFLGRTILKLKNNPHTLKQVEDNPRKLFKNKPKKFVKKKSRRLVKSKPNHKPKRKIKPHRTKK